MNIDIVPVKSERRQQVEEQILLRVGLFDPEKARLMRKRQKQGWAEQVDEGVYEVIFRTPGLGDNYLFFACPKSNVWYAQLPHLILHHSKEEITVIRIPPESVDTAHLC